jgi:hypothetical protein
VDSARIVVSGLILLSVSRAVPYRLRPAAIRRLQSDCNFVVASRELLGPSRRLLVGAAEHPLDEVSELIPCLEPRRRPADQMLDPAAIHAVRHTLGYLTRQRAKLQNERSIGR